MGENIPDDLFFLCPRAGPGQPQYPHMERGPHCGVLVLSRLPRPFPPFLEHVLKPCHLALGLLVPQIPSLFPLSLSAASCSSCSQRRYRSWRPAWTTKGLCSLPDTHPSFPACLPSLRQPTSQIPTLTGPGDTWCHSQTWVLLPHSSIIPFKLWDLACVSFFHVSL